MGTVAVVLEDPDDGRPFLCEVESLRFMLHLL